MRNWLFSLILLGACQQSPAADPGEGFSFTARASFFQSGGAAGTDLAETAELARLRGAGAARMILQMPARKIASTLLLAGTRDGVQRWRSLDNVQLYIRDGMIIGTRGLGHDLMTADLPARALPLTAAGAGGSYTRIHRLPDGSGALLLRAWLCEVTQQGTDIIRLSEDSSGPALHLRETCHGPEGGFTNHHWIREGRLIRSWQYLTDAGAPGQIRIQYLPEG